MVLDFIFSLSLSFLFFFFLILFASRFLPLLRSFSYLHLCICLYISLSILHLCFYLLVCAPTIIYFFRIFVYAHLKSFHRIIYRLVRRLHLFFYLLYIYQLTHVNFSLSRFACLSLYKNAPLLSHVPSFSLAFSYVCISCVFDGISIQTKKKISHDLNLKKKKKNRCAMSMRSRGSQVRPRRFSRCDCRTRYTVACCHREFATRATCAARRSPRSSP